MNRGRYRIGGQLGLAAAALAAGLAASVAQAQQTPAPTPVPTPAPSPTRSPPPNVMYLPNVVPERFTLGRPAATPTPAAPLPPPAPVALATPRANAPARATPTPRPAPAPVSQATPPASAVSTPIPAAIPTPDPSPIATAEPAPASALPAPEAAPAGMPGWLWMLIGAGATALVFGGAWALQRRRRAGEPEIHQAHAAAPTPPAVPPPPARPVAPPPGIAPRAAAPPAAPSGEPFEIVPRPARIEVTERDILLEYELLIGNNQASAAENIRVTMAMMTASPDQDRNIAGFHANPMVDPAGTPFDLAASAGGRMPVRLALPRELVHVVEVAGRPMFVPLVMIELKWRAGISLRRFGADFMIGAAGQGAKLGPIWLDRDQQTTQLAATRYFPRQAVAA